MRVAQPGLKFGLPFVVIGAPALFVSPSIGILLIAIGLGIMGFYRDPPRTPPKTGFLAPADGRITVIRRERDRIRVGVFMNVTNVHINRAPIGGTVRNVTHRPGAHRPAFSKDSDRNERVDLAIDGEFARIDVSLIAGTVARRISPYVSNGDQVHRGERIGHIAFGSRADILLPEHIDRNHVSVEVGERVTAGESVVALQKIDRPPGRARER